MTALEWLLWLGLAAIVATLSVVHYRRRETAGRGRLLLAGLRSAALALLLLLMFNPDLPVRASGPAAGTLVLLDASLSMSLPADTGTRWSHGVRAARARADGRPVLLFGDRVRAVPPGELPAEPPGDPRTLLLPALRAAAEAGARRVVVITDGTLEDAAEAARWAPRLGVEIVTEAVGAPLPNRAIVEAGAPVWVEANVPFAVEFAVAAPPGDSLHVVARSGGRVLGRTSIAAPAEGRLATGAIELSLTAPAAGTAVAVEVVLEGADPVPDDDVRTVYVHVAAQPAGVALVSFRPDWEPRFLAPVVEQALGIPVRAYLAGAGERWVRLGGGLDAGRPADEAAVRQAVERADVVVLHALPADAPDWAAATLRGAPRILVFPAEPDALLPLQLQPGAVQAGDWFPVAVPASPLAGLLAGQELGGIPPLASLLPLQLPAGAWSPLLVSRGRQGAPLPALIGGSAGGRRWIAALASGYWQWAFRGGEERQLYTRLWSAAIGWLARERPTAGLTPVRPAGLALPRGLPIPWLAPGVAADSLHVAVIDAAGVAVVDTVVAPVVADTAWTAAVPPGTYSYRAAAWSGDTVIEGAGPLTIERYSPEFTRAPVDLAQLRVGPRPVREAGEPGFAADRRGATPLHATPWPWILLVLLLATEWILRRRWGLR